MGSSLTLKKINKTQPESKSGHMEKLANLTVTKNGTEWF